MIEDGAFVKLLALLLVELCGALGVCEVLLLIEAFGVLGTFGVVLRAFGVLGAGFRWLVGRGGLPLWTGEAVFLVVDWDC